MARRKRSSGKSDKNAAARASTLPASIVGGQKKHGSKYHYGYATAAVLHRRHRYTVGLLALKSDCTPHDIVTLLLMQVQARDLRLRGELSPDE